MAKNARKKRKPKTSDKKQSERFLEAARKLDAEKKGELFEEVFSKIVPARKRKE